MEETSRGYLVPVPCPTSAPILTISMRDIIIFPGFISYNHEMSWVKAHLVPAPLPRAGTPSTRPGFPKPHPTWPWTFPGVSCFTDSVDVCCLYASEPNKSLSSRVPSFKPCPRPGPALLGVPHGSGMLWNEVNEAQSKEPLTQQERAGGWELAKKNYPQTFMAFF